MSRSVNINFELLEALVKLKPQPRSQLLKIADKSLVTAICECALNILNGNVPITLELKDRLFKERNYIRSLAKSKVSWKSRRAQIHRREELIPLIIEPVIQALKNE